jgi:hypothetical protein
MTLLTHTPKAYIVCFINTKFNIPLVKDIFGPTEKTKEAEYCVVAIF